MPQIESGIGDGNKQTIAPFFKSARVEQRPTDYGAGGHYRIARRLVPAATTLAGILWEFRNPLGSGLIMLIEHLRLRAVQVGAPTAAVEDIFMATHARAFTATDATGSVSIAPAANMQDMRTDMANSLAVVRESNIAAGASAGTKTEDGNPFAIGSMWVAAALPAATGEPKLILDYAPDIASGRHPALYEPDEGFTLRNINNFGLASGIALLLELEWLETTEAKWAS